MVTHEELPKNDKHQVEKDKSDYALTEITVNIYEDPLIIIGSRYAIDSFLERMDNINDGAKLTWAFDKKALTYKMS